MAPDGPTSAQEPAIPEKPAIPEQPTTKRVRDQKSRDQQTAVGDLASTRGHVGFGERVLSWIVPERNPAGAVYGIITIGALLAAESGLRDSYADTVGSVSIAVVLYWFAHSYADVLGLRISEQRRVSWGELWHTFTQDWAIVRGASLPLLTLLVAWALGASQETAVAASVWMAVASLIVFELAAGLRSRAEPVELALQILVGATMGLAILALRALIH